MTTALVSAGTFVAGFLWGFWFRRRAEETERALITRIGAQLDEINARAKAEREARVPDNDPKAPG